MRDDYCGDACDYAKYGLLLELSKQYKVGLNCYHIPDVGIKKPNIAYLSKEKYAMHNQDLYELMQELEEHRENPIVYIKNKQLLKNIVFYDEIISQSREAWYNKSIRKLRNTDLICLDAEKSLQKDGKPQNVFAQPEELIAYYKAGKDVLYMTYKASRNWDEWEEIKARSLTYVPGAKLIALQSHLGMQRTYIFVIHPEHYEKLKSCIDIFLKGSWHKVFQYERIKVGGEVL